MTTIEPSRAALVTDFDGTVAPIVEAPEDAMPVDGAVELFTGLAQRFAVTAVVSGRSVEDLRSRFAPPGVLLFGSYGRERGDRLSVTSPVWDEVVAAADLPGVDVERKAAGVALHYRRAPALEPAAKALAARLAGRFGLLAMPGRMVVELVEPGPGKGDTIRSLLDGHGLRQVVFAGDDLADAEAFEMLSDTEHLFIAIGSPESPPMLLDRADVVVGSHSELLALLRRFL